MAAVIRAAPLLLAFGARTASRASASQPRALSRAAAGALRSCESATFAARAQLTPRYRVRYTMAQAAQNEAMPPNNGPVASQEDESERKLRLSAEQATAAYKMSAVDAKARRIASPRALHCCCVLLIDELTSPTHQVLQRMLDELGLDTPGKLRRFVTRTSLPVIGLSLLESVLNGVGSWAALMLFNLMPWDAAALVQRGWSPAVAAVLLGMGQASTALAAGVLGANCIFSSATFFAAVYASAAFDINARSFLEAVHRKSGGVGIGLPHAAGRAAASIKAVQQLASLHEMLESRALQRAERGGSRTSLALHLNALADRGVSRGLSLAALALAPEEAATLSRLFARHDADGDDKLTPPELRAAMEELQPAEHKQPVSDDAARAAFAILDADGDGKVSLDEFAAWYATSRLWKHGEALESSSSAKEAIEEASK